jgi:hypothetical protein
MIHDKLFFRQKHIPVGFINGCYVSSPSHLIFGAGPKTRFVSF